MDDSDRDAIVRAARVGALRTSPGEGITMNVNANTHADALLCGWQQNLELAQQLLADVPDAAMTRQVGGLVNHPAWTLAHLNQYQPAILSLLEGEAVADPAQQPGADRYDAGSQPVDDPARYPTKAELLTAYEAAHERIEQALQRASADRLAQPPTLPWWADAFGTTARVLSYLMVFHEAVHLGQVMAWRRAMGMAAVSP